MNANNILETIKMIEEEKLDIRTITMGISLLDCINWCKMLKETCLSLL